jgi:ribosome-associated toxin RatA of RatAB toxin-antitoxin module
MIRNALICMVMLAASLHAHAKGDSRWPEPPQAARPSAVQLELLRRGDILLETTQEDRQGGAAQVRALFRAQPRQAWDTLGDCTQNFRFVQGLKECEVLEETETTALTRQVAKKYWLAPTLEYRFETRREPFHWIQIRLVDGDLRELQGSWRFDVLDDSEWLLVTHEIRVWPATPAPRWLVRRTLHRDLQSMLACLRFVTGASLDESLAQSDQQQCPEPASPQ